MNQGRGEVASASGKGSWGLSGGALVRQDEP